jgi:hypothetical protein
LLGNSYCTVVLTSFTGLFLSISLRQKCFLELSLRIVWWRLLINFKYMDLAKWKKIARNIADTTCNTPSVKFQRMFNVLCKKDTCVFCKKKFKDGIIRKAPRQNRFPNAYDLFTTEYLVHVKTTHGFEPEDLTEFILEIINN